jgi:hypothetical protein
LPKLNLDLQPKQAELYLLLKDPKGPSIIGVGGGRGGGKTSSVQRSLLLLMSQTPRMRCSVWMRTFSQVTRYWIEEIKLQWPELKDCIKSTMPGASLRLPNGSQLDFLYSENLTETEKVYRSANYSIVVLDQAEQASDLERREISKAARSAKGTPAKTIHIFNMRGAGLSWLRDIYHFKKYGPNEREEDHRFVRFGPWDNYCWVASALETDGYTADDYYAWTDEQRREYSVTRGEYTRLLASGDPALVKADFDGSWDSIEGCYFSHVYDQGNTTISAGKANAMNKPWSTHWISSDYGVAHFCPVYWHYRVSLSPSDVQLHLGWVVPNPLTVVVTYRELVLNGAAPGDSKRLTADVIARTIAGATPELERRQIRNYFLSPECCTMDPNCIAFQQAKELKPLGMPSPVKAQNARVDGWQLMAKLLRATKFAGMDPETGPLPDVWLISSECPALLEALPKAIRNAKNIDDVLKTDLGNADVTQDVLDAVRYGLLSMLSPRKKTADDEHNEALQAAANDPAKMTMLHAQHYFAQQAKANARHRSGWQQRLALISGKR